MSRSFAQSSLLALTLGVAALGSTLTPAAALPSMHPGSFNTRLPSLPARTSPGTSMHPGSAVIRAPRVAQTVPGISSHPGSATVHLPQEPIPPGTSAHPGSSTVQLPQMPIPPGASKHPDSTTVHLPQEPIPQQPPQIQPVPTQLPNPIDNICPYNKFKCVPKPPTGPGSAGNPGSSGPMPGGQTYPSGGAGPVVIVAAPPVYQAPQPVYQAPVPVYQAPRPVVTATNAPAVATTAPCNCLTKQYLDDGSVLFQDLCTKEAAMATPDELRAQAQAAAPAVR